jgi:hypothetical protein
MHGADCSITQKQYEQQEQANYNILNQISVASSLDIKNKTFVTSLIDNTINILTETTKQSLSNDNLAIACNAVTNTMGTASRLGLSVDTIQKYDSVINNIIGSATIDTSRTTTSKKKVKELYEVLSSSSSSHHHLIITIIIIIIIRISLIPLVLWL